MVSMKKALIAVGAVVAAFVAGLAGVYFAMPALSPEMVGKVQVHRDSLAVVDRLYSLGLFADSTYVPPDSLALTQSDSLALTQSDSLALTQSDSLALMQSDSLADAGGAQAVSNGAAVFPSDGASAPSEGEAVLQDSVTVLQHSVEGLIQEKGALLEQLKALQEQFRDQQTQGAKAQELSATLTKLEDKELAGVVEQLDMAVLEILYKQASGRNRARLLQAMPPQVAASFVQRLVQPTRAAVTDTLSGTKADGSEPLP